MPHLITDADIASRQRVSLLQQALTEALSNVHAVTPDLTWLEALAAVQQFQERVLSHLLANERGE